MWKHLKNGLGRIRPVWRYAGFSLLGLMVGWLLTLPPSDAMAQFMNMSPEARHEHMIAMRDAVWHDFLPTGKYACCLMKPCSECTMLDPYHGEDSTCTCLKDVMEGHPPCGECVGGILAGRGNRFVAKHFAKAVADSQPGPFYEAVKEIVAEKYNVPVDEQM